MISKIKKIATGKLIFLFLITAIIVVGFSLSKYETKLEIMGTSKIAIMANDVYVDIENTLQGYPGCNPYVYEIIITNKENEKICEVAQKYVIKIEKEESQNLPLEVELYKDVACTQRITKNGAGYYNDVDFVFDANIEQTNKVYLKVNWPSDNKNPANAFEIDYFRILVNSDQIN